MGRNNDANFNIGATDTSGAAFKNVQKNLQKTASAAALIDGPLGKVSGRLNTLGAAFGRFNPISVIGAAAVGAFSLALKSGAQDAEEYERQMFRMEAQLKATGNAAGFTAKELAGLAEQLDATTLADDTEARNAISQLLVFKKVAGDTFETAIKLAQDYSEVSGKSLSRTTKVIGRALDSIEGLQTLNREMSLLTKAEEKRAKALLESGELIKFQTIIVDKLTDAIGGSGQGAARGAAGATDSLALSWRLLKRDMSESLGVGNAWVGTANRLSNLFRNLRKMLPDDGIIPKIPKERVDIIRNLNNQMENLVKQQTLLNKAISENRSKAFIDAMSAQIVNTKKAIVAKKEFIAANKLESEALNKGITLAELVAENTLKAKIADEEFAESRKAVTKIYEGTMTKREQVDKKYAESFDNVIDFIAESNKRGIQVTQQTYQTMLRLNTKFIADRNALNKDDPTGPLQPENFDEKQQKAISSLNKILLSENEAREVSLSEWFIRRNDMVSENVADSEQAERLRLGIAEKFSEEHIKLAQREQDLKNKAVAVGARNAISIGTSLAAVVKNQSKTAFRTYQTFAATEATISAYLAYNAALKDPTNIGPTTRYLAAGSALAAGLLQVHNILSLSPGSSGRGGSAPSGPPVQSTPEGLIQREDTRQSQEITINLIVDGETSASIVKVGLPLALGDDSVVLETVDGLNTVVAVGAL